ncbi:MAG: hypothetical protein HFH85_17700 [Lachnospiraceae bacterium]|nr:hypothetical protein [Lachnospiraceae bacterium]
MSRKDYRRKRCFFNTCSIGMFGEYIYAFEQLTGSCDVPEYHQITKDEYETADCWIMDDCKVMEILRRPILCDGYRDSRHEEFDEEEIRNSIWGKAGRDKGEYSIR